MGSDKTIQSEGSGFFILPGGYAATNNHVVRHARSVTVTTYDGKSHAANVVGSDPSTDLALLKINARTHFVRFARNLPHVGDWVLTIGDPFELDDTVTAGIVSALGRNIDAGPYDDFAQIEAPINRGNSGGPAFDLRGNVVGVTTSIYSPCGGSVGVEFAIPATIARRIIVALKDNGRVVRGWMGVHVQSVTADIADSLGMKKPESAIVTEPVPARPPPSLALRGGRYYGGRWRRGRGPAIFGRLIGALRPGRRFG